MVALDGTPHRVRRGRTLAHADHPIVQEYPDLWKPLPIDFPAPEDAAPSAAAPSTKAVRAWARESGIEVPARGPLPDDVVATYLAAQE